MIIVRELIAAQVISMTRHMTMTNNSYINVYLQNSNFLMSKYSSILVYNIRIDNNKNVYINVHIDAITKQKCNDIYIYVMSVLPLLYKFLLASVFLYLQHSVKDKEALSVWQ